MKSRRALPPALAAGVLTAARGERPAALTVLTAAAATEAPEVNAEDRTITGLCVPFGPVGYSSMGAVTFARGAIRMPAELGRVKLLRQHDPDVVLGYATKIEERDDGLWGTFSVPASPEGDTALAEARDGRRDGLSVGVRLDEDVLAEIVEKWWDGDTSETAARGDLAEVSQVSLPAFDDARVDGSAALAAALGTQTLTLTFGAPTTPTAAPAAAANRKDHGMFTAAQLAALAAAGIDPTDRERAEAHLTSLGLFAAPPATPPAPTPGAPAAPAPPATPPLEAGQGSPYQPARVSSEPPVYTFDGNGPSFVRDAYHARFQSSPEASARYARFNAQLLSCEARQGQLLVAAVETRATAPNFIQQGYRPEMLIEAIDRGRPLTSRIGTFGLTDATPFRVPVEGDFGKPATFADGATTNNSATVTSATAAFAQTDLGRQLSGTGIPAGSTIVKINSATSVNLSQKATATASGVTITILRSGVGDHTEGQAHVAEGDLDVGEQMFTPGAISGAYRLTRELIDATNPALDRIAIRAMNRDYQSASELKVAAALAVAAPVAVTGTNTVVKARQELNRFYDVAGENAPYLFSSVGYYDGLLADVDTTGRPQLANTNPVNAAGTIRAGFTGANIDQAEVVKANRVTGDTAYAVVPDDVLVGESSILTFRFEEVEGPGVVKLALWSYFGAKVVRSVSVRAIAL